MIAFCSCSIDRLHLSVSLIRRSEIAKSPDISAIEWQRSWRPSFLQMFLSSHLVVDSRESHISQKWERNLLWINQDLDDKFRFITIKEFASYHVGYALSWRTYWIYMEVWNWGFQARANVDRDILVHRLSMVSPEGHPQPEVYRMREVMPEMCMFQRLNSPLWPE